MKINELIEKRERLLASAKTLLNGDVTAETRTQFDAIMADVTAADADIARVDALEKAEREQRSAPRNPRPVPGESADPSENAEVRSQRQKASFREYLRNGQIERRDLTASANGVVIPVGFNPQVIEAQKSYGEIYNLVEVIKTDNGEPVKYVFDDDTSHGLVAVTSGTDASEVDPTLTGASLQVDNFTTGVIKVDMALLQDAGFDVDAFIRDKFGKRFFRGASSLIFNGNSGNVAALTASVPASGTGGSFTSAGTGVIGYSDFATAIGNLDPTWQGDAMWHMNNATLGKVVGLVDANARPLFLPEFGSASQGFVGTILGRPVKLVQQLPNVATGNVSVLFGSLKDTYVFRQVNPGLGILRLNERYAPSFEVGFVAFARVGGMSKVVGSQVPTIGITIK